MFDQRFLVNGKEKGDNAGVAEGESHSIMQFESMGLRHGNGPEVLSNMTFVLNPPFFHFLTGPGEAGKTWRLRLMYLAMRAAGGAATLFGRHPRGRWPAWPADGSVDGHVACKRMYRFDELNGLLLCSSPLMMQRLFIAGGPLPW